MKEIRQILCVGTLIISALLGGSSASAALESVGITYVKSPLNVPSIVERKNDMFENAFAPFGLSVNYSSLTSGPEQTQALASGDLQFLNAVGATSVFLARAGGADICILSVYSRSPKAFRLFAAKGCDATTPQAMRGKKIAGPRGTILHELLSAWLAKGGMTTDDVQFISMGLPAAQAALAAGQVDGALLAGPLAYTMERQGYRVITTGQGLIEGTIVTATSRAFARNHPELVKAFLATQRAAVEWISDHHAQAMTQIAEETGLAPEAVATMEPMYDFDPTIRQTDIDAMKRTMTFMVDAGMIATPIDVPSLIYGAQ